MAIRRVVVLGAGYAGGMAANRVTAARLPDVEVTVVNPVPEFVQRIRLHQHAVGSGEARLALSDVLAAGVRVDRKSTRLNFSHLAVSRMPSSA